MNYRRFIVDLGKKGYPLMMLFNEEVELFRYGCFKSNHSLQKLKIFRKLWCVRTDKIGGEAVRTFCRQGVIFLQFLC